VKIGFALPVSGAWATPANISYVARRAEELGYHSLWTFQRLLADVDGRMGETYRSVHDPLVTLAYAASVTSHIRLGIAVVNMPFVSPALLAKQTATLDILCGGRLDVGLGLGWADREFVASGASKHAAGRRADEFIVTLRSLWTDAIVSHEGEFYEIPPSRMEPKPVQKPHPPILLGGFAPPALRRAGRLADGWISSGRADLTTLGASVEIVRDAAVQAGRDPASLRYICRGSVKVRDDAGSLAVTAGSDRPPLLGTLEQIRADLDVIAGQGMTELFVDLNFDPEVGTPDADPAETLRRADRALDAFASIG
jgi:probable F420-dependent oxidoreductase